MAFIFCQPEIYRNELYQDKIFMQGVRPIGADNKIFPSEQAPTEYFIIHSCMSHSNSKIVAISTVKHLSRNYASFSNQVCKSGIAYPLLVRRKISRMDTADFHGDGYILQNTGLTKDLRIAFVVCDVNSEKEQLQVNFLIWEQIFSYEPLK